MKARDIKNELRALDVAQLKEKLAQLNLDLFNYRMTAKLGNLEKPSVIQAARRTSPESRPSSAKRPRHKPAGAGNG